MDSSANRWEYVLAESDEDGEEGMCALHEASLALRRMSKANEPCDEAWRTCCELTNWCWPHSRLGVYDGLAISIG